MLLKHLMVSQPQNRYPNLHYVEDQEDDDFNAKEEVEHMERPVIKDSSTSHEICTSISMGSAKNKNMTFQHH